LYYRWAQNLERALNGFLSIARIHAGAMLFGVRGSYQAAFIKDC
jgi:hypothetical protein